MRIYIFIYLLLLTWPLLGQGQNDGDQFSVLTDKGLDFDEKRENDYLALKFIETKGKLLFVWHSNNDGEAGNASICPSKLIWEIDKKAKEFSLKDDEIEKAKGMYWQICRTSDRGFQRIKKGIISGKKTDDGNWEVKIKVEVEGHLTQKVYRFEFEEIFVLVKKKPKKAE